MSSDSSFVQNVQIVPVILPQDVGSGGVVVGDYVHLALYDRVTFVVTKDAGNSDEDPDLTLFEAQDAGGTGVTALAIIDTYYLKEGDTAVSAVGTFTRTTQSVGSSILNWAQGENEAALAIEVRAQDLSDGFTHVTIQESDPGASGAVIAAIAILWPARYAQRVTPTGID